MLWKVGHSARRSSQFVNVDDRVNSIVRMEYEPVCGNEFTVIPNLSVIPNLAVLTTIHYLAV